MGWIGWDRLMFSTDYPHWDFDHPQHVFKFDMTEAQKAMVGSPNHTVVYIPVGPMGVPVTATFDATTGAPRSAPR